MNSAPGLRAVPAHRITRRQLFEQSGNALLPRQADVRKRVPDFRPRFPLRC